jgi:cytochrome P450
LRPPDGIAEIAEEGARRVRYPNGVDAWLFARYDDVRFVLSDARFSAARSGDEPEMRADPIVSSAANLVTRDGMDHRALRRPLSRGFLVKRVNQLRPRIQQIVDEHLDAMQRMGQPADLVSALCLPVPSLVIAELLGVPHEHQPLFQRIANTMFGITSSRAEFQEAAAELGGVLAQVIEHKRRHHITDDLLGMLVHDEDGVPEQMLPALAIGLLAAGHETTANIMGLSVLTLFDNPDQLDVVLNHPDRIEQIVEELLRYVVPVGGAGLVRRATEDVEVGTVLVRAGEWVAASMYANFDQDVCPRGDRVDVAQPSVPHVSFGFGPHQCLGQNLARAELQIMITSLFGRFPRLRLAADIRELPYRDDMLVYGTRCLPVAW